MDQELIAYLDERFRETSQQIAGLREETMQQIMGLREETTQQIMGLREATTQQITGLREETTQQITGFREETTQQITGLREGTTQQITSLREATTQQIVSLREEMGGLRGEFESFRAETGRNFDRVGEDIRKTGVLVEDVRREVQVVAEGVKGANERLDAFKAEVAQEFKDVRSLIHLSYKDLDRRIRRSDEGAEGLKIGTPG
jgi:archaellum component FlaC